MDFEAKFNLFCKRLSKKVKLSEETKSYLREHLFKLYKDLNKNIKDEIYREYNLHRVFKVPIAIINMIERKQLRRTKDSYNAKNFIKVIEYFSSNFVSERKACKEVLKAESLPYDIDTFVIKFREWYNDFWNFEMYPEIYKYLQIKAQRKNIRKEIIKEKKSQELRKKFIK
jgi:hypothetical protein